MVGSFELERGAVKLEHVDCQQLPNSQRVTSSMHVAVYLLHGDVRAESAAADGTLRPESGDGSRRELAKALGRVQSLTQ
jgi:hypothetical protein